MFDINLLKHICYLLFFIFPFQNAISQEVIFFDEGTNSNFYDQGIVNVNDLGESTFEHTYPPGGSPTKWNDKVPCSTHSFKGATSLKFNYKSAVNGNWQIRIDRKGWSHADISELDSLSFYIYSESELPNSALPLIAVMTNNGTSSLDTLANYNAVVPAKTWTQIRYPLSALKGSFDLKQSKAIIFAQSEFDNSTREVLIDEITAFKSFGEVPVVSKLLVTGYDSHAELNWDAPLANLKYKIYASFDNGESYELRKEISETNYLDFVPEEAKNKMVHYRVVASIQGKDSDPVEQVVEIRDFTDEELMDMVQEYSFRYFWEGAHQASGTSLERSNGNGKTTASGATGFQLMAMIVAHEREYRPREEVKDRILKILNFLETCERHRGAWAHWYDSNTGKTKPFSQKDNGGDIVETSFVAQALVALKNYFSAGDSKSIQISEKSDQLWKEINWDWYRNGKNALYWHWSPNYNFEKNMKVSGWNESMITYIMAAASPTYGISKDTYVQGWARNGSMISKRKFYGYEINLARNWGGPLFWIHYSHHGINPKGLKDDYADYWQEHVNTALIHYEYAKANPLNFKNYSENCWGLTASDDPDGYTDHKPMDNDNGTVSPTAALASMPYTPEESMKALKYFYRERGNELFGKFGPYDAFNDTRNWIKESYIGIDQGPIVIMIENHRTGLLWKNVMKDADVQAGLEKLGFEYELVSSSKNFSKQDNFEMYPNPASHLIHFSITNRNYNQPVVLRIFSVEGRLLETHQMRKIETTFNCSHIKDGLYIVELDSGKEIYRSKLIIQK